jgi:hypothetical protein
MQENFNKPVQLSLFDNLLINEKQTNNSSEIESYSSEKALKKAYIKQGFQITYVEKKEGKYEQ